MRPFTTAATVAALSVLSVIPASAQDGPVRLQPCETSNTVLVPGTPVEQSVAGPTVFDGETTLTFTLDLSGQTVAADEDMKSTAKVNTLMSWTVLANDYDLGVNGTETEGFQPIDPAEEFVPNTTVAHCGTITVSVINFTATGLDPVDVSLSARL